MTTKELLPGDIISLSFKKRTSNKKKAAVKAITTAPAAGGITSDTTVATGMHFYTVSYIYIDISLILIILMLFHVYMHRY